jgi:DNA-binding transcriptional ArsR family regulator
MPFPCWYDNSIFLELSGQLVRRRVAAKLAVVGHIGPAPRGNLSAPHALAALAALGQPTRLEIFRLLVRCAPDGLAAGTIAATIKCPNNTLSSHLAILARAGLVRGTRDGRSISYRADLDGMRALVAFLLTDCCNGHPEVCAPISSVIDSACGCPEKKGASDGIK